MKGASVLPEHIICEGETYSTLNERHRLNVSELSVHELLFKRLSIFLCEKSPLRLAGFLYFCTLVSRRFAETCSDRHFERFLSVILSDSEESDYPKRAVVLSVLKSNKRGSLR